MICYLAFLNWCESFFFWHLLLLLFKKCSLNHKAIMCEEAKWTCPGRGKKWSICKFTPEANHHFKSPFCFTPRFFFPLTVSTNLSHGSDFFGKRFGGHDFEWSLDSWKHTEFAPSIVIYICLVVTSDYLRVSNHAIMVFGVTTFYFKL